MPQKFTSASINFSLEVLNDIPDKFIKNTDLSRRYFTSVVKMPLNLIDTDNESLDNRLFYFCKQCKGWIKGLPTRTNEKNIGPLWGRDGSTYSCRRCGVELGFVGKKY